MGKKIAKKIRGMSLGAKISLITLATLLVSVFMYEGWYQPYSVHAVAKTYNIDDSNAVTIATGVTTNTVSGTNPTSATPTPDVNEMKTVAATTTSNRTTGTYTAGATMLESIYNTAYATSTTVTGTSYFGRLRDGSGGYTVGFQLFYVAANGTKTNFTGAQATQVLASGASADYTVSLAAQSATVPAGSKLGIRIIYVSGSSTDARVYYGSTASSTSTPGGVVTVDEVAADTTPPTVTINQAGGQADPTGTSPINFTVVFSEATTNFATGDVTITGTAGGTKTATVTGSGTTYNVAVTGMTTAGTVIATIGAGVATDAAGNGNTASTSTDNTVTWNADTTPPTVTINQAGGQADPTGTSPINFSVVFSEATTNFATGDVTITGTAGGTKTATVTGSGTTYNVAVTGMTTSGTVIATIGAGVATDAAGNGNTASTSTDNTVTWDNVAPTVTINQAGGQSDPSSTSPINFAVVFSESTTNFATGDVTITGTAGGTKTATVTGSGTTYNVAVSGMTTTGTVIATIAAGAATDAAGNGNTASTSTDNTVTWNASVCTANTPTLSVAPTAANVKTGAGTTYTVTVTNNDTAACTNTTFTPSLSNDNGTSFTFGTLTPTTLNIAPGASGNTTFTVTANGTALNGAVNISTVGVTAPSHTAPANVTATTTVNNTSPLMHNAANVNPTNTKGYGADWGSTFTCATCHAENTSNVKLVAITVATPNGNRNVVFTRMTSTSNALSGVFGNDNRTYSGNGTGGSSNICEVCHRKTTFHRYSANAPDTTHYNNKLCLTCHPHGAGFKGSGHTVPYYATSTGHTGCASGIGCHTNSTPGGTYPTAGTPPDCQACHTKGDPTTAGIGCGSCHGAAGGTGEPNGTVHPDAVGSHPKHTALTTCTNCHDVGGDVGGNADHGRGNRDTNPKTVNLAAGLGWNGGTSSCSTATCHANVYGTTGTTPTPAWGTASGCGACHTGAGLFQANGAPNTGGHNIHMTAGAACGDCHTGAVSGTSGGAAHADGDIDVANGYNGGVPVTKHAAGSGYSTCASATCHANPYASGSITTNVWSPTSSGCGACHKNDATNGNLGAFVAYSSPSTQVGPKTASHEEHLNYNRYVCADCHSGAVSGSTGGAAHGNSVVNVIQYASTITKHQSPFTYLANGCTTSCHGAATWGATLGCINCHAASITRTKGRAGKTLAAVTTEFGLAWGHKKSGRGTVSDADCIVCHLEGNFTTQRTSKFHADGNIDMRDPDVQGETPITNIAGGAFTFQRFSTSYATGSRTATVNETIANVISQKFCLKCHDNNGAANTTARSNNGGTGTATMPFGGVNLGANYTVANGAAAAGGLIDVKTQFATTNSSFHPVLGPRKASYPYTAKLVAPYNNVVRSATTIALAYPNNLINSVILNCFDCHNVTSTTPGAGLTLRTVAAHGNAVSLRGYPVATTGTPPAVGTPVSGTTSPTTTTSAKLCLVCHLPGTSTNHGSGSAFSSGGSGAMSSFIQWGCNQCHGSSYNTAAVRPVRALDVHGVNILPTNAVQITKTSRWAGVATGTPAVVNARPYAFIRNTQIFPNHMPKQAGTTVYTPTCMGGSVSPCSRGVETYTPGGSF